MRRFALFIVVMLALASGFSAGATPRSVVAPPQLRLHRATFDARAAGRTAPTAALAVAAPGPYAIIQFGGPIGSAASGAYTRSGPNNSVIAWSVGSLPAGQSVARTLTVRVSPTASSGETIAMQVTASAPPVFRQSATRL
jgi:hypothetical protein